MWRHAGQQKPAFQVVNTGSTTESFYLKQDALAPTGIIRGDPPAQNEKVFWLSAATVSPMPLDLLDVNNSNGANTRDGDDSETLGALADRFTWRADLHDLATVRNPGDPNAQPPVPPDYGANFPPGNGNGANDGLEEPEPNWDIILGGAPTGPTPIPGATPVPGATPTPRPYEAVPAWRIAGVGTNNNIMDDPELAPNQRYEVPLALSVGVYLTPNLNLNTFNEGINLGGVADLPLGATSALADEDLQTVRSDFYQTATLSASGYTFGQALLRNRSTQLSGPLSPTNSNLVSFRPDYSFADMPAYYVSAPRLERGTWGQGSYNPIPITVQATIYAQDGSWFVIPMPMKRATPIDTDGNGTSDPSELAAVSPDSTYIRRLNYNVRVVGTIAQNFTPTGLLEFDNTSDPDLNNMPRGAMAQWLDSMSYPTAFEPSAAGDLGASWMTVTYASSPLDKKDLTDGAGLYLPASPDLMYTG
jgi:hypothetical protein